jgi:hypothetical protein
MCFRQLEYKQAFTVMGCCIMASSVLSVFIHIKGHSGLLWGTEDPVPVKSQMLAVPEPDAEKADEVNEDAVKASDEDEA